jgi:hypothetical protein
MDAAKWCKKITKYRKTSPDCPHCLHPLTGLLIPLQFFRPGKKLRAGAHIPNNDKKGCPYIRNSPLNMPIIEIVLFA